MPTEDPKKNTTKDNKDSLLLQFKKAASKKQKVPDPLLFAEQLTDQLDKREVKTLIEVIGDIQRDPTKQPAAKPTRSKVIPDPEKTQSTSEKLLTCFRSKPDESSQHSPRPAEPDQGAKKKKPKK